MHLVPYLHAYPIPCQPHHPHIALTQSRLPTPPVTRHQVDVEHYQGDFPVKFMGQQFWNSYHNITNIMLHIARKGSEHKPAVMVVAHHDSPVSSQGERWRVTAGVLGAWGGWVGGQMRCWQEGW